MAGDTVITVVGNLTADPELRFTASGAAVASFTIASTPRTFDRNSNEWKDGEALFLRCSLWRQAAERMRDDSLLYAGDPFVDPWALEVQSAALAAHARHGRLEPVVQLAGRLRERLLEMLSRPPGEGAPAGVPVYGTVLLALGLAGLAAGDPAAVRLVALAERMPVVREFPSMSSALSRQAAENADRAAYADARSEYAALERDELRAAVLRELTAAGG